MNDKHLVFHTLHLYWWYSTTYMTSALGWVNPHIRVRWSLSFQIMRVIIPCQVQKFGFIMFSNTMVTNNTSDCSISLLYLCCSGFKFVLIQVTSESSYGSPGLSQWVSWSSGSTPLNLFQPCQQCILTAGLHYDA